MDRQAVHEALGLILAQHREDFDGMATLLSAHPPVDTSYMHLIQALCAHALAAATRAAEAEGVTVEEYLQAAARRLAE
jgi:hypothetical protein